MQLQLDRISDETVRAGYQCTCGCKPALEYTRDAETVENTCCCGTHFAVGPDAEERLASLRDLRLEVEEFTAPWGGQVEAAWAIGTGRMGD